MESKKNCLYDCPPSTSTFIPEIKSNSCYVCNEDVNAKNMIGCEQCSIKVHRGCLIKNEPMWVLKLEVCPWFCKSCREFHCSQCLKIVTEKLEFLNCVTCKVGMHYDCFNSLVDKPLQRVKHSDLYICIPCEISATHILEEQENENESEEEKYHTSSSDKMDEEEHNDDSINSSLFDHNKESTEVENEGIPNVTTWSKYDVYDYLSNRVPKEVLPKIIIHEIDGRALQLLKRQDITLNMGLRLGYAMKLYKEVRILQSRSTYVHVYWE